MSEENFVIEILLKARDEASAKINALKAEVAALKDESNADRDVDQLGRSIDNTGKKAETAAGQHRGLNEEVGQHGARARQATSASEDYRTALERQRAEAQRTRQEQERLATGAGRSAAAHDTHADSTAGLTRTLQENVRAARDLGTAQRDAEAGSRRVAAARRDESSSTHDLGARIEQTLGKYQAFDRSVKEGSKTTATTRAGYRAFASDINKLAREAETGTAEFDRLAKASAQATKSAKNAGVLSAGSLMQNLRAGDVGGVVESIAQRFKGWGIAIGSVSANLRGLRDLGMLGLFQQLDTAAVSVVGGLFEFATVAGKAASALGGTFTAAVGQAIPGLAVFAVGLMKVKSVLDAVTQAVQLQKQTAADAQQQQIQVLSATANMIQAQEGLKDSYVALNEAQQKVRESQLQLTDARRDAARQIVDLMFAEKQAVEQEKGADISLRESELNMRALLQKGGTSTEVSSAQLQIDEARTRLQQAQVAVPRAQQDSARARSRGVEGSTGVRSAQLGLQQSEQSIVTAKQGIGDATRQLQLAVLMAKQGDSQLAQARAMLAYTLSTFSSAQMRLYRALLDIEEFIRSPTSPFRQISNYIVAPFANAAERIDALLHSKKFMGPIDDLAKAIGSGMNKIQREMVGPRGSSFIDSMAKSAKKSTPIVYDSIAKLMHIFEDFAQVAQPSLLAVEKAFNEFVSRISKRDDTKGWQLFESKKLEEDVHALETIVHLVAAFGHLLGALGHDAFGPAMKGTQGLTGDLNKMTAWVKSHGPEVKRFFDEVRKALGIVFGVLGQVGVELLQVFNLASLKALGGVLTDIVLPAARNLANAVGFLTRMLLDLIHLLPGGQYLFQALATAIIAVLVIGKVYEPTMKVVTAFRALYAAMKVLMATKSLSQAWGAFSNTMKGVKKDTDAAKKATDDLSGSQDRLKATATSSATAEGRLDAAETAGEGAASGDTAAQGRLTGAETAQAGVAEGDAAAQVQLDAAQAAGGGAGATGMRAFLGVAGRALGGIGIASAIANITGLHNADPLQFIFNDPHDQSSGGEPTSKAQEHQPLAPGRGGARVPQAQHSNAEQVVKALADPAYVKWALAHHRSPNDHSSVAAYIQSGGHGGTAYAAGGLVPGAGSSDTVNAKLTPGEFVVKKQSVSQLGVELLRALNEGKDFSSVIVPLFKKLTKEVEKDFANLGAFVYMTTKTMWARYVQQTQQGVQLVLAQWLQLERGIDGSIRNQAKALVALVNAMATAMGDIAGDATSGLKAFGDKSKISISVSHMANPSIPGAAVGMYQPAQTGGQIIRVGEGGHNEVVLTTDPAHATRQRALLGRYLQEAPHVAPGYATGGYVNPYKDARSYSPGRTDEGYDAIVSGRIDAIGNAVVTYAGGPAGWPGTGAVVYRLTDGPDAGRYVYLAENITPVVHAGQRIRAGAAIANAVAAYPYTEMGWASGPDWASGTQTLAKATTGYHEGEVTRAGSQFAGMLGTLGVGGATGNPNAPLGTGGMTPVINAPQVKGGGVFGQIAQKAINRVTTAANAFLQQTVGVLSPGGNFPGGAPPFTGGGKFLATAYGPPWGGIEGPGTTATGIDLTRAPHRYIVAVDPSVIPMHSKLKVWPNPYGYAGFFSAEDTGGAIKGHHIDIYDWKGRSDQNAWGSRDVSVKGFAIGGLIGNHVRRMAMRHLRRKVMRFGVGGEVPNAPWGGRPVPIVAHEGEWVVNPPQQERMAQMAGASRTQVADALFSGRSGMPRGHYAPGGVVQVNEASSYRHMGLALGMPSSTPTALDSAVSSPAPFGPIGNVVKQVARGWKQLHKLSTKSTDFLAAFIPMVDNLTQQDTGVLDRLKTAFGYLQAIIQHRIATSSFGVKTSGRDAGFVTQVLTPAQQQALTAVQMRQEIQSLRGQESIVKSAMTEVRRRVDQARRAGDTDKANKLIAAYNALYSHQQDLFGQMDQAIQDTYSAEQQALQNSLNSVNQLYDAVNETFQAQQSGAQAMGQTYALPAIDRQIAAVAQSRITALQPLLQQAVKIGDVDTQNQIKQQMASLMQTITQMTVQAIQDAAQWVNDQAQLEQNEISRQRREAAVIAKQSYAVGGPVAGARVQLVADQANQLALQSHISGLMPILAQAQAIGDVGHINTLTDQIKELQAQLAENTQALQDDTTAITAAAVAQISTRGQFQTGVGSGLSGIEQTLGQMAGAPNVPALLTLLGGQNSVLGQTNTGLAQSLLGSYGVNLAGLSGQSLINSVSGLNFDQIEAPMSQANRQVFEGLINSIIQNDQTIQQNTEQIKQLNGQLVQFSVTTSAFALFRSSLFTGMGGLLPNYASIPGLASGGDVVKGGLAVIHDGERVLPAQVVSRHGDNGDFHQHLHLTNPVNEFDVEHESARMAFHAKTARSQ